MHLLKLQNIFLFILWIFFSELVKLSWWMFFLILPECVDLFYTLYLLDFSKSEIYKALNRKNVRAKDRA